MEEFAKGAFSGAFGLALSHPFDTIKTRLQTNQAIEYGVKSLYRGVVPPLFGVGFEKAVVFGVYNNFNSYFSNPKEAVSTFTSGMVSGLAASFIVTPVERLKIGLQKGQKICTDLKLFKGLSVTFTREVPGFGIYFTVYEQLKQRLYTKQKKEITKTGSFLAGGLSGATAWLFIYPQDLIKTRIQSGSDKPIKTMITDVYRNGGIKQFYKGFHLALLRAVPLHAGTFFMMEFLSQL